jgi:hypothetical protein
MRSPEQKKAWKNFSWHGSIAAMHNRLDQILRDKDFPKNGEIEVVLSAARYCLNSALIKIKKEKILK